MNDRLRVLYVCYLSLSDPLVETQVLSYLEGLAKGGHTIHLLTFETRSRSRTEREALQAGLLERGIRWHHLKYHKRPSLPATVFDVIVGAGISAWLMRRYKLAVFHARVHVPAAIGLLASPSARRPIIFDVRGLMAEEYVDAGRWKQGGIPWRLTKWVEKVTLERSIACIVLTPAAVSMLPESRRRPPMTVVPCCADLERFERGSADRAVARERFGFSDEDVVLVYTGKFGGWYLHSEMVSFFSEAREEIEALRFLIVTQEDPDLIEREFHAREIPDDLFMITQVAPEEMGSTLAAADLAISFVAPLPSKRASSPTKVGEYLAAGLPVVVTAGVGAMDQLIIDARAGVLIDDRVRDYRRAARDMAALLSDDAVAARCRGLAERELSLASVGIPRYAKVYESVARALQEGR